MQHFVLPWFIQVSPDGRKYCKFLGTILVVWQHGPHAAPLVTLHGSPNLQESRKCLRASFRTCDLLDPSQKAAPRSILHVGPCMLGYFAQETATSGFFEIQRPRQ